MTTASNTQTKDIPLLAFVQKLKEDDDRGSLATLRGALSGSAERQMRAWRLLARFGGIPTDDQHHHTAEVVRTVAGLLAMPGLSHSSGGASFGRACRELLGEEERKSFVKPEQTGPVARRVQYLLAATRSEVCDRVRQLGRRLDRANAALDFRQLYSDLVSWEDDTRARWAADFWGTTEEEGPAAPEGTI
jgi:CRISPR type I-E-associated protein CasB/Cse2